jgi:pimeloyl-ACP methyl ester carboxylesterase
LKKLATIIAVGATLAGLVSAAPALGATSHQSTAPAKATAAPGVGALKWGACNFKQYPDLGPKSSGLGKKVKCAALKVPLNYGDPTGKQITLEVSMLRHTSSAANYNGVMLSNPGGPGGESLDLSIYLAPYVPHNVGADYDWVTWDPRGVGVSKPALHCQNNYFDAPRRSYDPTSKSLLNYWLKRSKAYANACEKDNPGLLQHMTTIDSAKDMNSIREALGVSTVSYYGFSYGTYLGQVFSTLYPSHLKYMVLDSNVDPRKVWYKANLDQDKAFNRNIQVYFRWVAKYNNIYHLGATRKAVSARYYSELAALTKHPKGKLGPDEWIDAFTSAGYYRQTWEGIAHAWHAYAINGKPAEMIGQYQSSDGPGDDNEFAVYNAVQCTDTQWPTKWSTWKKDNDAYNKKYPFLTWSNAWFNAPCLYWGAKAFKPVKINGDKTKSVLLIDETLDAATPYPGSLEVRKLYPNSSLIAEPGGATHADSLDGDACVDDQIAAYLQSGKRPSRKDWNGPDSLCKPLPDPAPTTLNSDSAKPNQQSAPAIRW